MPEAHAVDGEQLEGADVEAAPVVLEVRRREDPVVVVEPRLSRHRLVGEAGGVLVVERDAVVDPVPAADPEDLLPRVHHQGLAQVPVGRRAVVALDGVVLEDLPVAVDRPRVLEGVHELGDVAAPLPHQLGHALDPLGERRRTRVDVHPHHRSPHVGLHRHQAQLGRVELRLHLRARRAEQSSVEVVAPPVVVTLEDLPVARLHHHRMATVPADVDEAAELAGPIAHEDDRYAGDLPQELVTRLGQVADMGDVVPGTAMDAIDLPAVQGRVGVPVGRERPTGVDRGEESLVPGHLRSEGHEVNLRMSPVLMSRRRPRERRRRPGGRRRPAVGPTRRCCPRPGRAWSPR